MEGVQSPWQQLSADIFTRVLDCLPFKSRVRDTVLVCKSWSALCLANPPRDTLLEIKLTATADASFLRWLAKSCTLADEVVINMEEIEELPRTTLAQVLTLLGLCCSAMRHLNILFPELLLGDYDASYLSHQGWYFQNFAGCLPLLKQLEHLALVNMECFSIADATPEGNDNLDWVSHDFFKGLALKSLSIQARDLGAYGSMTDDRPLHTIAMARALTSLTGLTRLSLQLCGNSDYSSFDVGNLNEAVDRDQIMASLCQLTALRSLVWVNARPIILSPDMSSLSNLTALCLRGWIRHCHHIALLPLRELQVTPWACQRPVAPASILGYASPHTLSGLTRLEVMAGMSIHHHYKPIVLPDIVLAANQGLVHLRLEMAAMDQLSLSMLRALPNLTQLDLSWNHFLQLPENLSELQNLEVLTMVGNGLLQFSQSSIGLLKSVPKLRLLNLRKIGNNRSWTPMSMQVLLDIRAQLPNLHVKLL